MLRRWIPRTLVFLSVAALAAAWILVRPSLQSSSVTSTVEPLDTASYVGAGRCASCHLAEHAAWQGSQHARAMQHATDATVLGNFDGAIFDRHGVRSRFFRREGRFFVHTDGPDGKLADFEVKYTFGVEPLQQYLIELPAGRLQALSISWDTRPRAEGGQRWFHLYESERIDYRDELHWTRPAQNWNFMCADCHSTGVRRGYREATGGYETRWSELSVGCEACHGPGSAHITSPKAPYRRLVDHRDAAEMNACAACHARRAQFAEGARPNDPLMDHYLPSLLAEDLYHPDGQQQGEVFVWGSYVQSRKHAAGVTCGACHEPHTQKIRLPGNAVCTQCHDASRFDTAAHHRHASQTAAAQCVACHMRENTYMVIDRRRDHGFHVPRPDLTAELGVPNACADCHADRPASWAAAAIRRWRDAVRVAAADETDFALAISAGRRGEAGAVAKLLTVVEDRNQSPLVRASAIELLARYPGETAAGVVRRSLSDADPLVRHQALLAQQALPPARLATLIAPMLNDPVRANRHEAARQLTLAGVSLKTDDGVRLVTEAADYEKSLRLDLTRADAWVNLGNWQSGRGDTVGAENSLRAAVRLDPGFAPGWVNLADLLRAGGREVELEMLLRDGLARDTSRGALREALGLSLVRQGRKDEALREFARAYRAAPDAPRFRYVYALALHDAGRREEAIRLLDTGLARVYDRDSLVALAAFLREAGRDTDARRTLERLLAVNPDDPALAGMAK